MIKLSDYTLSLLDDIERRIDPDTEEDFRDQWTRFWYTEMDTDLFTPRRKKVSSPGTELKNIAINDALTDFELMLDAELADLSRRLGGNASLGIRANYGSAIMASLFGAEIFIMPRETNTLPTTRSFNDSNRMRQVLEKGIPDFKTGFGGDVLYFGERCAEIFEDYPKIKKYAEVYHPDTQGPLDVAELLWGGEMFYEMYDDPDFVHAVMRLITDTYKAFLDKWYGIIPKREPITVHWSIMERGTIMLRLDSAMNISADLYNEYSKPYDRELLDYYGGGCMHFCGRGDHYISSMCEIDALYGINLSQPHLNDMDVIFEAAGSRGKRIISFPRAADYAGNPHVRKGMLHS